MSEDRTAEFFALAESLPTDQTTIGGAPSSNTTVLHSNLSSSSKYALPSTGSTVSGPTSGRYGNTATTTPVNQSAYAELRTFHTTAATISRDIAATSALLSELTQLVRRRGLFMDDTDRVNYLVLTIKSNITNLNGRLDDAGQTIAQQKRKLGKHSQAGQEASNLVGQLQEEFVRATKGFKDVLQVRSDRMKETTDRKREVFGSGDGLEGSLTLGNKPPVYDSKLSLGGGGLQGGGPAAMPKLDLTSGMMAMSGGGVSGGSGGSDGMTAGESSSSGSQLPRPHGAGNDGSAIYSTPGGGLRLRHSNSEPIPTFSGTTSTLLDSSAPASGGAPLTPLDIQRMEQESGSEQTLQLIPDQTYLRERADVMTNVEANIVELGTIFNKLAVMVSEHREMVQRVEDNVDDAESNINLSLSTLTDTLTNLRSNKALFMKVFGVIVVFIILFITFFA